MNRRIYRVLPDKEGWRITLDLGEGVTKETAIEVATAHAVADWANGEVAQVVIHKQDGTFQEERTHGRDPERHEG